MKENGKKKLILGSVLTVVFVVWTMLIQIVDVQPLGQNGTNIGFSTLNCWFHQLTGTNMRLYTITDWMGVVPIFVCMIFAGIGLCQLVKRRSLLKVEFDIIILGVYYVVVIFCYLLFESIPINYRPILIDGMMEASYPSSTTLLVITVMPTLAEQVIRRMRRNMLSKTIEIISVAFSVFMVAGRLVSGVHWITDIVGAVLLSLGLFYIYKGTVMISLHEESNIETTSLNRIVYWILFFNLILLGCVKIALTQLNIEKGQKMITGVSMGLGIVTVLFLGMAKEPYALTVGFILLVVKGVLLFKKI